MVQQYIWSEICKLDSPAVNIVLDELMRTAVDGPFGSRRSEIITDTVGTLSSINVRGRILSKLRKVSRRISHRFSCHSIHLGDWQDNPKAHPDARGEPTLERNRCADKIGPRVDKSMQTSRPSATFRTRDCPPCDVDFVHRNRRDQALRPRNSDEYAPDVDSWKERRHPTARNSDPFGRVCKPGNPSVVWSCTVHHYGGIRQL